MNEPTVTDVELALILSLPTEGQRDTFALLKTMAREIQSRRAFVVSIVNARNGSTEFSLNDGGARVLAAALRKVVLAADCETLDGLELAMVSDFVDALEAAAR